MKRCTLLNLFVVLGLVAKLAEANEMQSDQPLNCPDGYVLSNGLCYLRGHLTNDSEASESTLTDQSATIKPEVDPSAKINCPSGSIFFEEQCRKLICPLGEFIAGRCLRVACPEGMVWRDHSCQEPEYLTTIIELENVFLNEAHDHHGNITQNNTSHTEDMKLTTTTPDPLINCQTETPKTTTTTTARTFTTQRPPASLVRPNCCTIHSPRLCKNYQRKWVCFNHRREFCDQKVCEFPTMYLKTPKIVYKENLLIMPPHPPLKACRERGCDSSSTVDCSGCARGVKENCSPYCYYYYCPEDTCGYMDLRDFCQLYPNHPFGCNQDDGCIWGWCGGQKSK